MNALMSGQIDAHFTSPPFQFQEKVRGAHVVGRSYNYFGAHTFLVNVMTQNFYDDHRRFAGQFYKDIVAMHKLIKTNPLKRRDLLSRDAGGNPTPRQFKQWIGNPALTWTTRPRGLDPLCELHEPDRPAHEDAALVARSRLPARLSDERELRRL